MIDFSSSGFDMAALTGGELGHGVTSLWLTIQEQGDFFPIVFLFLISSGPFGCVPSYVIQGPVQSSEPGAGNQSRLDTDSPVLPSPQLPI